MSKEEMQGQLIETPKSDELREYKMLIGGEWVDARSGKTFESINPYMGKVWARVRRRATHPLRKAISGK
jgi:(Z)-2-((N-methylformamido)methylene)-5-hydroxybutyrolactone dehydrogenase